MVELVDTTEIDVGIWLNDFLREESTKVNLCNEIFNNKQFILMALVVLDLTEQLDCRGMGRYLIARELTLEVERKIESLANHYSLQELRRYKSGLFSLSRWINQRSRKTIRMPKP